MIYLKTNYKRILPALLLVLILLIPTFIQNENVKAATLEGPAYPTHPVKLDQTIDDSSPNPGFTDELFLGRIFIDGVSLQGAPTQGAYIEITIDPTYVDIFNVPKADLIKNSSLSKEVDKWVYRVNLVDLFSSTKGSFPYELSMKNRITPENYELMPLIELKTAEGELIASN